MILSRCLLALAALALLTSAGFSDAAPQAGREGPTVPGEVLVRFRGGTSQASAVRTLAGPADMRYNNTLDLWRVSLPSGWDVNETLSALQREPQVALAQPNYHYTNTNAGAPDDPMYAASQRPYYAVVNAAAGWTVETGSPDVIVAVIDDGADIGHPELDSKIWTNPGEIENGQDDDANGCVDDLHGCSFLSEVPAGDMPPGEHGTFIAGIIGAETGNAEGVAGLAPGVTILPVAALDAQGNGTSEGLAAAILYAAKSGARVLNLSLAVPPINGSCPSDPLVEDVLRQVHDEFGVVVAAAAGNFDLDCVAYPGSSPYTIAVGGSGPPISPDTRAAIAFGTASQWGPEIDVAAPGVGILSTCPRTPLPGDDSLCLEPSYGFGAGTSFATPFVAALAALLLSQDPALSNEQVRLRIRDSARDVPDDDHPNWDGAGIIDVGGALGAGSAFITIDVDAPGVSALDLSIVVGDRGHPDCEARIWAHPDIAARSVRGTFGAGECAAFWPPSLERPWTLAGSRSSRKAGAVHGWSVMSGRLSCVARETPAVVPRDPGAIATIDCSETGVVWNDTSARAVAVAISRLPASFRQDLRYATAQGDPAQSCASSVSRTVWYRIAPTGAPAAVAADTFGSEFDTVLAVYVGVPGALSEIACNDGFGGPQSRLVWRTDGVSAYYVMAAAVQSVPAGEMRMTFSRPLIPANDDLAGAVAITPDGPSPHIQPTHSTTSGGGDPVLSCAGAYGFSAWFTVTAPASGEMSVDTAGSDYDTIAGVFSDGPGGSAEVACNDDAQPGTPASLVTWQANKSENYRVVIGAYPGKTGGVLHLRAGQGP